MAGLAKCAMLAVCVLSSVAGAQPRKRVTTKRGVAAQVRAEPSVTAAITVPPPAPAPGMTLPAGRVLVALTAEMSVARDSVLAPASVAPDLSAGVTDNITLSIIHSGSALTGFRGGAGAGICASGSDNGCASAYAGGGLEAMFSHVRGTFALASTVGLVESNTPWRADLKLGGKLRWGQRVYVLASPSVWFALDDHGTRMVPHENQLYVPLSAWIKATPSFAAGIGSGFKGPLAELGTRYAVPLGVVAQYTINAQWGVGASLVFGKVVGGDDVMDTGVAARAVQLWVTVASD